MCLVDAHGSVTPRELLQAVAGTELEMETTPNQTPICEFEVSKILMPLETCAFETAASQRWMQPVVHLEPEAIPRRLVLTNVASRAQPHCLTCVMLDGFVGEVCTNV